MNSTVPVQRKTKFFWQTAALETRDRPDLLISGTRLTKEENTKQQKHHHDFQVATSTALQNGKTNQLSHSAVTAVGKQGEAEEAPPTGKIDAKVRKLKANDPRPPSCLDWPTSPRPLRPASSSPWPPENADPSAFVELMPDSRPKRPLDFAPMLSSDAVAPVALESAGASHPASPGE